MTRDAGRPGAPRGGRDSIDHAPGAHDDLANALAGVASLLGTEVPFIFALGADDFARQGRGPLDPAEAERARVERSAERVAERLRRGGGVYFPGD